VSLTREFRSTALRIAKERSTQDHGFSGDDLTTETRIPRQVDRLSTAWLLEAGRHDDRPGDVTDRRLLDKDYIVNPQVRITLMEYASSGITIWAM